jgi:hypothetical protein
MSPLPPVNQQQSIPAGLCSPGINTTINPQGSQNVNRDVTLILPISHPISPAGASTGTISDLEKSLEKSESSGIIKRLTDRARTFTQTLLSEPAICRAPTIPVVDDFPLGYPRAAGFIASDDDFQVYRRYTYLHSRLLLHKQLEIEILEQKLKDLDSSEDGINQRHLRSYGREYRTHNHESLEHQKTSKRIELMAKLEPLLLSYDDLLFKTQQTLAMKAPSKTVRNSIFTYLTKRTTIVASETHYIDHKFDLVSLAPGMEKAWIDDFVAGLLRMVGKVPHADRIFCSSEDRMKARDPHIHYSTRWRVNLFIAFLITILIVTLLVVPVYGLFKITSHDGFTMNDKVNASIGILVGATFIMALMLSMFTRARRHESLAASAA